MNTSTDKKIEEVLELTKENNKLVKKMIRSHRWAIAVRIAYWLILIGGAATVYYIIQPFVDGVSDTFGGLKETFGSIKNLLNIGL